MIIGDFSTNTHQSCESVKFWCVILFSWFELTKHRKKNTKTFKCQWKANEMYRRDGPDVKEAIRKKCYAFVLGACRYELYLSLALLCWRLNHFWSFANSFKIETEAFVMWHVKNITFETHGPLLSKMTQPRLLRRSLHCAQRMISVGLGVRGMYEYTCTCIIA